jgi:N-methylhydantoinase B
MPHGLTIKRAGEEKETWLGSVFSDYPVYTGDQFARPTAGGGGFGDPLVRDPQKVLVDVIDDYVSIRRAALDYGVVIKEIDADLCEYEIDTAATEALRTDMRGKRKGWARMDPAEVSRLYKAGEIDALDAVRRYAVILDWESGEFLPKTTEQFRESYEKRTVAHWG